MQRIDIDDLDVDMDLAQRLLYRDELFTGEAVEYQRGVVVSLDTYRDGVKDGPTRAWYPDGKPRADGQIRNAVVVGEYREWHPSGVLARVQQWGEKGQRLESELRWDEQGQPLNADEPSSKGRPSNGGETP